jgi:osmoprotectant transport system permease protein
MPLDFLIERLPELLIRTREHLFLTGAAVGAAVLVGVPTGVMATGRPWLRSAVFTAANVVQTVPSLAMLAFLLAMLNMIGVVPAIVALTLYALLPILQNTVTALEGVPPETVEAARGMGMTPWQEMRMVKLPLAMPVLVAGIKTSAVISVGIATLSAFIGAGGLGEFIIRGLSLADNRLILLGAVPSALLALYVSLAIAAVEWGLNERKRRRVRLFSGRFGRVLTLVPLLLLFAVAFTGQLWRAGGGAAPARVVHVGSKNFTEQFILAEMLAQRLEAATGLTVKRHFNLGGTMICHEALVRGEIDMYPEYTGTALTAILNVKKRMTDPEKVYDLVSRRYKKRFNLIWLEPFGFNNTYALAVRKKQARRNGWKKISDLRPVAGKLRAAFTAEFAERPDGYPGFVKAYGIRFGSVTDMDPALMYDALRRGQVDVISAFATDSRIPGYNLAILEDDRGFFPPYYAAPVVRKELLTAHPEVREALAPLGGILDEKTMRQLNYEVDQKKREVADVVREFLLAKGL